MDGGLSREMGHQLQRAFEQDWSLLGALSLTKGRCRRPMLPGVLAKSSWKRDAQVLRQPAKELKSHLQGELDHLLSHFQWWAWLWC